MKASLPRRCRCAICAHVERNFPVLRPDGRHRLRVREAHMFHVRDILRPRGDDGAKN
jgi:hypothetical protein